MESLPGTLPEVIGTDETQLVPANAAKDRFGFPQVH